MEEFIREENYRGEKVIKRLQHLGITVCGVGALGSNFVHEIMRQGARQLYVIDYDRVEAHNIPTQMYGVSDIGSLKTNATQSLMWKLFQMQVNSFSRELTKKNVARLLVSSDLVIDTFDNVESRLIVQDFCERNLIPCLHLGMSGDGNYGEATWTGVYSDTAGDGEGDPCDVAATRNLISLVVALGCESVQRWVAHDKKEGFGITLQDLHIGSA